MKILVSGATGLIGSALCSALEADGHKVLCLSREEPKRKSDKTFVHWQPESERFEIAELEKLAGIDAAVHLAVENIMGRWTPEKKRRIRDSRGKSTRLLSETLAQLPTPPRVLVSASAVGIYGNRGGEVLREDSSSGRDFLSGLCRDWESATKPAREAGIRVVNARIGVVLSCDGGALQKMLPPFRLGLGGPIGSGRQYLSWIAIDDAVRALQFAIAEDDISGALNVVGPAPVKNREFVQTLGKVLARPAIIPLPAFAARLAMGKEAADSTLLISQRVMPQKLLDHNFEFKHCDLEDALQSVIADC